MWEGRDDEVVAEDMHRAALLALSHHWRRGPFERLGIELEELENILSDDPNPPNRPKGNGGAAPRDRGSADESRAHTEPSETRSGTGEKTHAAAEPFWPIRLEVPKKVGVDLSGTAAASPLANYQIAGDFRSSFWSSELDPPYCCPLKFGVERKG